LRTRDRALIALRLRDTVWIKGMKSGLDTLSPRDRRAVIWAARCLSTDEAMHWLAYEKAKPDPVNRAICEKVMADLRAQTAKKAKTAKKTKKPS